MSSPENVSDLQPVEAFKQHLEESGYVVCFEYFPQLPEDSPGRCAAVVIPKTEYAKKLDFLNTASRYYWGIEAEGAERDGRSISPFTEITELPWELLTQDPRFSCSNDGLKALSNSVNTSCS